MLVEKIRYPASAVDCRAEMLVLYKKSRPALNMMFKVGKTETVKERTRNGMGSMIPVWREVKTDMTMTATSR